MYIHVNDLSGVFETLGQIYIFSTKIPKYQVNVGNVGSVGSFSRKSETDNFLAFLF